MNIVNNKLSRTQLLCAISILIVFYSVMVLPNAYAQEQPIVENGKSGGEKLLTYRYKSSGSGITGIAPDFPEAYGKVFEFNVSATCTYESSINHIVTVSFKNISNYGTYVKSASGGSSAIIMTGNVIGYNNQGTPAFSVECSAEDSVTSIEVIALGRVIDTSSETDDHPRTHKKLKNGYWN
jgi:hypothetical protein